MAIYMQVKGIDGNITAKGHEKWIEVLDLRFSVGRNITNSIPGKATEREGTIPSLSEVVIKKTMDETSPKLFLESLIGVGKEIKIDLCKSGDAVDPYMQYVLNNVLISSYAVDAYGDSYPSETLTLNFDKITMSYIIFDTANKKGSQIPAGYDLTIAQKV